MNNSTKLRTIRRSVALPGTLVEELSVLAPHRVARQLEPAGDCRVALMYTEDLERWPGDSRRSNQQSVHSLVDCQSPE
jgi:hypothetical protein